MVFEHAQTGENLIFYILYRSHAQTHNNDAFLGRKSLTGNMHSALNVFTLGRSLRWLLLRRLAQKPHTVKSVRIAGISHTRGF